MTPEQALSVLFQAASKALLSKQDHLLCEDALKILTAVITPKEPKKDEQD